MTQYARPDEVVENESSAWDVSGAATIPEALDEESPSDSEYTYCADTLETLKIGLDAVTDPQSSSGHWIRWRWRSLRDSTPPEKGSAALYCDTTFIKLMYDNDTLPTNWTTEEFELTSGEADAITDYSELELHLLATALGSNEELQASWIEFSCPDAPSVGGPSNLTLLGVG